LFHVRSTRCIYIVCSWPVSTQRSAREKTIRNFIFTYIAPRRTRLTEKIMTWNQNAYFVLDESFRIYFLFLIFILIYIYICCNVTDVSDVTILRRNCLLHEFVANASSNVTTAQFLFLHYLHRKVRLFYLFFFT